MPWWGWILLSVTVICAGLLMYWVGHRVGGKKSAALSSAQAAEASARRALELIESEQQRLVAQGVSEQEAFTHLSGMRDAARAMLVEKVKDKPGVSDEQLAQMLRDLH